MFAATTPIRCVAIRLVLAVALSGTAAEKPKAPPEPQVSSIYPLAGQSGASWEATVRGAGLAGAYAIRFQSAGLAAEVLDIAPEPNQEKPADLVRLRIRAAPEVAEGAHEL